MAESATIGNHGNASKYYCDTCDYNTSKKSSFDNHILSAKHKRQLTATEICPEHICSFCAKKYQDRTGLWRHKKICGQQKQTETVLIEQLLKQNDDFKTLIIEQNKMFVEQNQEIQKQMIDICKNSVINNNTINNVNSHNKTFNLQVFLNEDCKDAMNITEFVNSIQLQLSDLEHVGQVGYVEGISNIIIKNLKALDVTKRPVHCTDQKRETIYIKDGDVWEKDEDDNKKLRKMIRSVAFRNCKNTRLFKEKYPDCMKSESIYSDIYNKIIIEVMGGGPKSNDIENQNKIIRKIAKVMTIDKSNL
jgi:hypothetical protein